MSENVKIDPVVKITPVYTVKHKSDGDSPSPKEHFKSSNQDSDDEEIDTEEKSPEEESNNADSQTESNKKEKHIDELV